MAESLVSLLLDNIATTVNQQVQEEAKLALGVEKEFQKLNSNLLAIQAVLEDAERRQLKETSVRDWISKLKDLSYDIEDVLDEWTILKRQTDEGSENVSKKMVCSFLPSPRSCFQKVIRRRDITLKIKEVNEKLDGIARERAMYGFLLSTGDEETERFVRTSFVDESRVIGQDAAKKTIVSRLLSGSSHEAEEVNAILVVGMGGIGKTTLAQLVYNDDDVQACFEERIWVCVSDAFGETRIARAIFEALTGTASNLAELQSFLHEISEFIKEKKFLLVLDDVWTENCRQWKLLKLSLSSGAPGSRIIVATRDYTVATMIGTRHIIELGKLSQDICWSIFSQAAFHERSKDECERLTGIGQKIADKCKGSPLAAKVLGGLMLFKRTREEWEQVLSSELWEAEHVESGIFPPFLLSYYDLPAVVRRCFIYHAMFPKDYEMSKHKLIKLWMAHGFLKEIQNTDMELVGEEYFKILAARSFYQDFRSANVGLFSRDDMLLKMHDIVHDSAQSLTKNETMMVVHSTMELSEEGRFPVSIDKAKNLSSLLIDAKDPSLGTTLADLFKQLKFLRSLNLSGSSIQEVPSEVDKLINLRYLDLAKCRKLKSLPETICNLCYLQSLDVYWCLSLKELPQAIGKLTKLRHLEIEFTGVAFIPKGIERLTSLRTLTRFIVCSRGENESKAANLGELKNLNHLRGTLLIKQLGNIADVSEAEKAELKNKKHLHCLALRFDGEKTELQANEDSLIEALQPPSDLEILYIIDYSGIFLPNWMKSLTRLMTLQLHYCGNLMVLPTLGKLPNLENLLLASLKLRRLDVGFLGIENVDKAYINEGETAMVAAFPKLKVLQIEFLKELEEWDGIERRVGRKDTTTSIIMPQLQYLNVSRCPTLRALPDYVLTASLQRLEIWSCPLLSNRYKKEEMDGEWQKISHIPKIRIS